MLAGVKSSLTAGRSPDKLPVAAECLFADAFYIFIGSATMKKPAAITITVVFAAIAVLSCGCASRDMPGMADTQLERQVRINSVKDTQRRQLVDDWDLFWLQDRPSRLSQFPVR